MSTSLACIFSVGAFGLACLAYGLGAARVRASLLVGPDDNGVTGPHMIGNLMFYIVPEALFVKLANLAMRMHQAVPEASRPPAPPHPEAERQRSLRLAHQAEALGLSVRFPEPEPEVTGQGVSHPFIEAGTVIDAGAFITTEG